jgi:hypothetical protein
MVNGASGVRVGSDAWPNVSLLALGFSPCRTRVRGFNFFRRTITAVAHYTTFMDRGGALVLLLLAFRLDPMLSVLAREVRFLRAPGVALDARNRSGWKRLVGRVYVTNKW